MIILLRNMTIQEFLIEFYRLYLENNSEKQRVSTILPKEIYNNKASMFALLDELVDQGYLNNYQKCQGPTVEITDEGLKYANRLLCGEQC